MSKVSREAIAGFIERLEKSDGEMILWALEMLPDAETGNRIVDILIETNDDPRTIASSALGLGIALALDLQVQAR